MMRKIAKAAIWTLIFFVMTLALLPKTSIWYQIEHVLKKKEIIIDQETVIDNFTHISINEGIVYFGNLEIALVTRASLSVWVVNNRLTLENLLIGKDLKMLQGIAVKNATIVQNIFQPFSVNIQAEGNFGSLEGKLDLSGQKITLDIIPSKLLLKKPIIMRQLTKTKEGYQYVRNF